MHVQVYANTTSWIYENQAIILYSILRQQYVNKSAQYNMNKIFRP